MKFAFSTVGCPDYQWSDVYSMAKDLGYDGIEVRGLGREFSTFNMQPFSEGEVGLTVKKLAELRLSIPCLSSGCVLKFADKREENLAQLKDYIHLAQKLNCPYVRVMGDYGAAPDGDVDDEVVASQLRELRDGAEFIPLRHQPVDRLQRARDRMRGQIVHQDDPAVMRLG